MTTELTVESGMHIEPDAKTGAIAASQAVDEQPKPSDDQPEQTPKAEANEPKEPVDPRKAIMDKIYANRSESFKKELEYAAAISMGATVEPVLDEGSQPAEEKPEAAPEVKEEPKPVEGVKGPKEYIIAGQKVLLTEEQLQDLASRTVSAEQRLATVPQQIYQPVQPQQPIQAPVQQATDIEPQRLKEIARKISYGNEEESARALADLVGLTVSSVPRPQQGPTPEQIVQAAVAQTTAQLQFKQNLDTIANEYSDVFQKRSSTLVAADYVNSLRNKYAGIGIMKPDVDLYREACNLTREEFGIVPATIQQGSEKKQVEQPNLQTKLERKRSAPQPALAAHKVSQADPVKSLPTGSDIVARMRKSRGQVAI